MGHQEIIERFKGVENSAPATDEQKAHVAGIRGAVLELALQIDAIPQTANSGRYKATALTKLETAAMFAVKGVFQK